MADGTRTRDNWNHNPGLYQLSYSHRRTKRLGAPDRTRTCNRRLRRPVLYPVELRALRRASCRSLWDERHIYWSGWRDLNSRHPGPKPGALPGYATPRKAANCNSSEACRSIEASAKKRRHHHFGARVPRWRNRRLARRIFAKLSHALSPLGKRHKLLFALVPNYGLPGGCFSGIKSPSILNLE